MGTIKRTSIPFLIAILLLSSIACRRVAPGGNEKLAERLSKRKDITILVTDSGLGGLSVVADLATRMPESGIFRNARVVFFSSLFKERSGYNSLKNDVDKARIFQVVLEAMEKKYAPDLLLIGCNTLSVVYHDTPFSQRPKFPAVGIVEAGAGLIADQFERTAGATAVIFATRTTIESEAHKNWLVEHGYPAEKIIGQACHRLAGAINRGYQSEETMGLIRQYVAEALAKLPDPAAPLFVSLNCTDYGYSIAQFRQVFAESGYKEVSIIDPNSRLADFLFSAPRLHRFSKTQVTVEVVSKTQITEDMIASVGSVLESLSPQTAEALRRYRHEPGLFDPRLEGLEFID
jgi:glutamate racemase